MPAFCNQCGAPVTPDVRFCEQCGAPVPAPSGRNPPVPFIPLLELHEGTFGLKRTPAVMGVTPAELRVYRLMDYFTWETEDLRNRIDDAWMAVSDREGDWRATVTSWEWEKEPLITAVAGAREELAAGDRGLLVLEKGKIRSIGIEQVGSDTVWDIMTIDCGGNTIAIDLTGPVAWHAYGLLSSVLGEKVSYEEE